MIKRFIGYACISLLALFFSSCEDEPNSPTFTLKGSVNYNDVAFLYYAKGDSLLVIDTIDCGGNQFDVSIPSQANNALYVFTFPGQNALRFFANPGDVVDLKIDINTAPLSYEVIEGNELSRDLARLHGFMNTTLPIIDSLDGTLAAYRDSSDEAKVRLRESNNAVFRAVLTEHHDSLVNFVLSDTTRLANVIAFYHSIGENQLLSPQYDLALYYAVDNGIASTEFAEHPLYMTFHREVNLFREAIERRKQMTEAGLNLQPGNLAPSIVLNDPMGKEKKSADLRGKVVLIHFWASWDPASRIFNRRIAEIWEANQSKGFDIYSVSFDGIDQQSVPRQEWRLAIEEDGMAWDNHVSDLKGYKSPIAVDFAIDMLPGNILIDERGMIIGRNLSPDRISEILGERL